MESNETKCLGGGRIGYLWIDAWVDSERELHTHGSLNHLCVAFLSGFHWPVILICLVQSPDLVYLRILPCMPTHLLDVMESTKKPYGELASFSITLFLTSKGPFFAHVVRKVSWFQEREKMWSRLLCEQGSMSSFNYLLFFVLKYRSTENKLQMFAPGPHLSSASILSILMLSFQSGFIFCLIIQLNVFPKYL